MQSVVIHCVHLHLAEKDAGADAGDVSISFGEARFICSNQQHTIHICIL